MKVLFASTWSAFLLLAVLPAAASTWTLTETSRDTANRLAAVPVSAAAPAPVAAGTIRLDPAVRHQEMIGFGGALTESSAWVLAQLEPGQRAEVLRRYYDPVGGIGYTIGRTHLNSCDFSLNLWALDEVPGDYDLHHFSLAPMRRWLLPLLQDARRAAGGDANFKLLVSPWSPPAWMKTNNRMDDGGSLRREYAAAWADYYVRFVRAMAAEEKFPVWAFTVQNEPEAHQTWESCLYTPEQERDFVKNHLGPAFERAGLLGQVLLIGWDHNRDRIETRADALFRDPAVAKYIWGLGVHWYVSNDFAASARVTARYPDKPILFTEGCWEGGDNLGIWKHGENYARQMIGDFRHSVAAFIDWNIVLDQRGGPNHVGNFCDAPVLANTVTKEVTYTPAFYYIGHFSKFVKPGARRIACEGGPDGLESVAFQNPDGTVAAVVLNPTDAAVSFTLAVEGNGLECRIPAHAIQTYVQVR